MKNASLTPVYAGHIYVWALLQGNLFEQKRSQPSHVLVERVTTTLWSAFVFLGHFHSLSLTLGEQGPAGNYLVSWIVKSDILPLYKELQPLLTTEEIMEKKIMKENLSDMKKSQLFSVSAQPGIKRSI